MSDLSVIAALCICFKKKNFSMVYFISYVKTLVILDALHITFRHTLCAYLDPGTGSIIFQVIIAGLCGGLLVIKLFWAKIKNFFKNLFSKGNKAEKNEE